MSLDVRDDPNPLEPAAVLVPDGLAREVHDDAPRQDRAGHGAVGAAGAAPDERRVGGGLDQQADVLGGALGASVRQDHEATGVDLDVRLAFDGPEGLLEVEAPAGPVVAHAAAEG